VTGIDEAVAGGRAPATISERRGYAQVACAAAGWGLWSLFLRPAERVRAIAPALETFLMFAAVAVGVLPMALRERRALPRPAAAWAGMVMLGLCDATNCLCFFWAMQRSSLAVAVLTHYLAPPLIAVAAPFVLRERARPSLYGAVAVALAGLVLLVEPWHSSDHGTIEGALLGSASAVFYAATTLFNKSLQRYFVPYELLGYHAVPAAIALLFFVPTEAWSAGFVPIGIVSAGGLLLSAAGGVIYLQGLARVPASRAAVLTLFEPMVAVLVGATVWGEQLGLVGMAGVVLVLGGAYAAMRAPAAPSSPGPGASYGSSSEQGNVARSHR
jgi:drug/metabolite transporter (DMT)-like permease